MQYRLNHLQVEFTLRACTVPADQAARLRGALEKLDAMLGAGETGHVWISIIHHERRDIFHVEFKLKLPGRTFFSDDWDLYMDSAFQRAVDQLGRAVADYQTNPDRHARQVSRQQAALDRGIIAPADGESGELGRAAQNGDYQAFRKRLGSYEEWLRKRVGRWVQRYPEIQAHIDDAVSIADLVEEVYLNAFEQYPRRPADVPMHEWLDGLIDDSLRAFLKRPRQEKENISLARTLNEAPH